MFRLVAVQFGVSQSARLLHSHSFHVSTCVFVIKIFIIICSMQYAKIRVNLL